MRKAIVTGASGFIGSWLAQELLNSGYAVTVVVRDKGKLLPVIRNNCMIVEKPICEISMFDFDSAIDMFFHLAWEGVFPEQKNELDVQLKNIRDSLNALEVANQIGCGIYIAAGTVSEYALCDNVIDMSARPIPGDFYGAAKVSAHYFQEVRAKQLEQPFIWTVISSTFGERRIDNNIITYTIRTLLSGEKPVYGCLDQMWDFLYVKDVVRALRMIGEKGKAEKVYGIGSGDHKLLRNYICSVRDLVDPSLPLGIGENQSLSKCTVSSCVNTYDLIKDTGFQPEYSFEDGIKKTIEYFKRNIWFPLSH